MSIRITLFFNRLEIFIVNQIGLAVFDAIYPAARNRNFFPELLEAGLSSHAVNKICFFGTADPNTWIDIGETIEAKIEALRAHQSQV